MNRTRRTVGLVLAGVLTLGAAACGSDDNNSSSSGDTGGTAGGAAGAGISLAVNPWTGSAVNANVAKVVLESKLNTATTLVDIDENATWPGLDSGSLDAVLEVWPSGHAADK